MTPEQIRTLAKQAGVQPYEHSQPHRESISFTPAQLAEFVRLVRESALDEAATFTGKLAKDYASAQFKEEWEVATLITEAIRNLK